MAAPGRSQQNRAFQPAKETELGRPAAARLKNGRLAAASQFVIGLGFPLGLVLSPRCSVAFITVAAILAALDLATGRGESGRLLAPEGIWQALRNILANPVARVLALFAVVALVSAVWAPRPDFTLKRAAQHAGATLAGLLILAAIAHRPGRLLPAVFLAGFFLAGGIILADIFTGGHLIALVEGPFRASHYDRQIFQLTLLALALLALPVSTAMRAAVLAVAAILAVTGTSQATQAALAAGLVALACAILAPRLFAWLVAAAVLVSFVALPFVLPRLGDALPPAAFDLLRQASPDFRLVFWEHYGTRLWETPVNGHGFESSRFVEPVGTITRMTGQTVEYGSPYHPHNAVLQVWYELGLVGVVLVGAFLLLLLRQVATWSGAPFIAAMALFCGAYSAAMVANSAWPNWRTATFFLFAALLLRAWRDRKGGVGD
jgi:O-antigen ligase